MRLSKSNWSLIRRLSLLSVLLSLYCFGGLTIFEFDSASGEANGKVDYSAILKEFRPTVSDQMTSAKVPGLAIALVDRERTVWAEGFGSADPSRRLPVTGDTPFCVASVSKTVTTTAVLMAVQEGLVDLDEPITTYLPWFTVHSRLEKNPEGKITLRHLLSHTAGFTSDAPIGNNYEHNHSSFDEHIKSICDTWLRFKVGERFSYSNLALDLAGYIVQVASRKPFPEYVHERLLTPLGMSRSTFDLQAVERLADRAIGYGTDSAPVPLEIPLIPAGAFHVTANDMARFIRLHLGGGRIDGKRVVDERLLKTMYTIPFPIEGQNEGYALGIDRREGWGTYFLSHSGRGYGFQAFVLWYPEAGIGAVVLTNSMSGHAHIVLAHQLLNAIWKARQADSPAAPESVSKPPAIQPDLDALAAFTGSYFNERNGEKTVAIRDKQVGLLAGEKFAPLTFYAPREAYLEENNRLVRYRFLPEDGGSGSCLVRIGDGVFFDYNRGPRDIPGPDKPDWKDYCGTYSIRILDKLVESKQVRVENGYLFIDQLRALEYQPGLFFESTGEALDFRTVPPTWGNIKLEKQQAAVARADH